MDNKLIIFPNDSGGVVFCYPNPNSGLTLEEIARKDVPAGKPYLLVPDELVPKDHTFFDAFEADFTTPDGFGIGADAWFAEQEAKKNPPPVIDVGPVEPPPVEPAPVVEPEPIVVEPIVEPPPATEGIQA